MALHMRRACEARVRAAEEEEEEEEEVVGSADAPEAEVEAGAGDRSSRRRDTPTSARNVARARVQCRASPPVPSTRKAVMQRGKMVEEKVRRRLRRGPGGGMQQ